MNDLLQTTLIVLGLFGAFVIGAVMFNSDLMEKYETMEGAYNYVNGENIRMQEQLKAFNLSLENIEHKINNCDLLIENNELNLLVEQFGGLW